MNKSYDHRPGGVAGNLHESVGKPSIPDGRLESNDSSLLVKLNDDDAIGNPSEINGNVLETSGCKNHGEQCSCLSPPSNCDVYREETPEKHPNNLRQPCLTYERCLSPEPSSSFLHNSPVLNGNCVKRKLSRACSAPCLTRAWSPDKTGEISS
jgi:hypothetical protein